MIFTGKMIIVIFFLKQVIPSDSDPCQLYGNTIQPLQTMNDKILELFIKENEAWDDMITRQSREIPDFEKMLCGIIEGKRYHGAEFKDIICKLRTAIQEQGSSMTTIKEDLAKQQQFLEKEMKIKAKGYGVNTLMSQNILRERIKNIEKKFLDLKSNFLNYYASFF